MLSDGGMLSDKARATLFWFTISMVVLVAIVAVITILRACGGAISPAEPSLVIDPGEISLCVGEQYRFTVEDGVEVVWDATGGTISESGLFTASDDPGDHTITATRRDSRRMAEAVVHVVACTPMPTLTPFPTPMPTSIPTATPMPEVDVSTSVDSQGDVSIYESGAPIEAVPAGADIRAASVGADLRVALQPIEDVPAELADWAAEGEVLLWIALYEPIPDSPTVYTEWLFVLDLDGDIGTGRPVDSARVNPDLGVEAAVGIYYDPDSGEYVSYVLVWDPAQGGLVSEPGRPRFILDESRMLVGLAFPLDTLAQAVARTTGVTIVPEAVRGRAAVLSYAGEQKVVDFYPDRPD